MQQAENSFRISNGEAIRNHKPSSTETCVALADPMSAAEAKRFAQRYAAQATSRSKKMISELAESPSMLDYRSAFFFGLYAFDREYQYVPEFIRVKLSTLSKNRQITITLLALISFYTPLRVPAAIVCVMMGRPASSVIRIEDLFGSTGKQIVLFDGEYMGVVHPLISEEILRQRLTPIAEKQGQTIWQTGLADRCIELIDAFGSEEIRMNLAILEILKQLFIEREIWENTESRKKLFSELINSIPNTEAQNRIFRHLCQVFPEEAHFWHHFGRHLNYYHIGSIDECIDCFDKAIQLEEYSDVHHHGKGMVFRFAMKDAISRALKNVCVDFDASLSEIIPLCNHADACFRRSYELAISRHYPLVSNIQALIEAIEGLFNLWKRGNSDSVDQSNYSAFLMSENAGAIWSRDKLEAAEEMLEELKHLQANGPLSEQTVIVEGKIDEFLGDMQVLISGLLDLLKRKNANKPYIRRLFARAHFRRVELSRYELDSHDRQTILDMMRENLREDPANGHDLRIWLRVFRQQKEFTLNEAIERISTWATEGDSVDAYYYLYILHFLRSKQGVPASLDNARKYVEYCKRKAPVLVSKKSFEWWAASAMNRPCPLVNHSELGEWKTDIDFFANTRMLGYLEGTISKIDSAQSGVIMIDGMPAFFAPRGDFIRSVDLNRPVKCYIGFSYEGLRAWNVKKRQC
jgi:tetratricopeptide (TPR) repeat protein